MHNFSCAKTTDERPGVEKTDTFRSDRTAKLRLFSLVARFLLGFAAFCGCVGAGSAKESVNSGPSVALSKYNSGGVTQLVTDDFPGSAGGWRWVRTPGANSTGEIAIAKTPDLSRSDPDFAGLSIHCGAQGPELMLIVVAPFSPRTHPTVALNVAKSESHFNAKVLPSGAALLLPPEAIKYVSSRYEERGEVSVLIEDGRNALRGRISLAGFQAALQALTEACSPSAG